MARLSSTDRGHNPNIDGLLWLLAAVPVIAGIFNLVRGQILYGIGVIIILLIVACLVGPGGASLIA